MRAVEESFGALVVEDWCGGGVREAAGKWWASVRGREGGWVAVRRCA